MEGGAAEGNGRRRQKGAPSSERRRGQGIAGERSRIRPWSRGPAGRRGSIPSNDHAAYGVTTSSVGKPSCRSRAVSYGCTTDQS